MSGGYPMTPAALRAAEAFYRRVDDLVRSGTNPGMAVVIASNQSEQEAREARQQRALDEINRLGT